MENQQTDTAASSPAPQPVFEIPSDPKANLEWRTTGKLPDATTDGKPKEDSTTSASEEKSSEPAAASATAPKQEKTKQPTAADRLNEVLADLKKAGLSPLELKTFKREAEAAKAEPAAPAKAAPEKTANPQGLEKPVKPTMNDLKADGTKKYASWEEFDAAKDDYHDAMAEYRSKVAVLEDRQARAAEAQQQTLAQKVTEAKARYGDQTEATIGSATRALLDGGGIPLAVQDLIGGSPVLVDVMFALGSDAAALASFVDLAKTDPAAAIRKFVLLEHLTTEELAKGSKADKGAAAAGAGERGEDGKFVSTPPAKQRSAAPPPPEELNTRGSAPPDPIEAALRNDDFAAFKAAEDRKDIARRRGA